MWVMGFDFSAISTPFRMQPGLRRLSPGTPQLTPTRPGDRAQREKLAVLNTYSSQALLSTTGFDPRPALNALCAQAAREHPEAWAWNGQHEAHAGLLGWSLQDGEPRQHSDALPELGTCLRTLPVEWRLPALLSLAFVEDFAILDGTTAHIPWMAVCLPSGWAPEEKIGRHFAQVHAPVADNQILLTASEHLARLVTGQVRWERFVWTITRHARLHAHPDRQDPTPWPADASPAQIAQRAFFRTEHQTFIPLPELRQAVFTIHVNLQPLTDALPSAAHARQVHDALASMSPAVLAYRGLGDARDRLLTWLATQMSA